jgi:hypothetical protein
MPGEEFRKIGLSGEKHDAQIAAINDMAPQRG